MSTKRSASRAARPRPGRSPGDPLCCQLCGAIMMKPSDAYLLFGALREGYDVTGRGGECVHIEVGGQPIPAIVTLQESRHVPEGVHLMVLLCSRTCVRAIRIAAAQDAIDAGEDLSVITPLVVGGLRLSARTAVWPVRRVPAPGGERGCCWYCGDAIPIGIPPIRQFIHFPGDGDVEPRQWIERMGSAMTHGPWAEGLVPEILESRTREIGRYYVALPVCCGICGDRLAEKINEVFQVPAAH